MKLRSIIVAAAAVWFAGCHHWTPTIRPYPVGVADGKDYPIIPWRPRPLPNDIVPVTLYYYRHGDYKEHAAEFASEAEAVAWGQKHFSKDNEGGLEYMVDFGRHVSVCFRYEGAPGQRYKIYSWGPDCECRSIRGCLWIG